MKLSLHCNSFKHLSIEDIDVSSFSFYGTTEGYDYNDYQSKNHIGFCLNDSTKIEETVEYIKTQFNLNPDVCKVEDYIKTYTPTESYITDKRTKIVIYFRSGSKGWTNPPSFSFIA